MKSATAKRLHKAEDAIRAAELLQSAGHADFATGRAYYAMFYIAEALLFEKDLRVRTHGEVHGAFGKLFSKTGVFPVQFHRWLIDGYDRRVSGDYWTEAPVSDDDALDTLEHARQFLVEARRYLIDAAIPPSS